MQNQHLETVRVVAEQLGVSVEVEWDKEAWTVTIRK